MKHFELAHGKTSLSVHGNIIEVTITGAFNEYCMKIANDNAMAAIMLMKKSPFFILLNFLDSEGGTPEAYEESTKFNLWLNQQNMISKAIITKSLTFKCINESRVKRSEKQIVEYFESKQDALNWFKEF